MTNLDLKEAFFHVIDSHRWLAASGCTWNLVGHEASGVFKDDATKMLPNVDVLSRDCLLLHARSLIKFYESADNARDTDIVLKDFGCTLDPPICAPFAQYENAIEVHLLHLTDWRDTEYREKYAVGTKAQKVRPDWNSDCPLIVTHILNALKSIGEQDFPWKRPFRDLYDATAGRYENRSFVWPENLCEKSSVDQYLKRLGL